MSKAILFIIDGLGDLPTPKTPLQAAKLPNMDSLAKDGMTGLMSTISNGITPGSDVSHLQLFGYPPPQFYGGRGPLEALGMGFDLRPGDIALRANFATLEKGVITDRRAGRLSTDEARQLEGALNLKIGDVEFIFRSSTEHRGVLVLRGPSLSPAVSDTDSHHEGASVACLPVDDMPESAHTADLLNQYLKRINGILDSHTLNKTRSKSGKKPANMLLLRGAGVHIQIPTMLQMFGISAACIAGGALYKGVARYVGMDIINVKGATGTFETDLKAKAKAVEEALKLHDFVFLHVKACDSAGHDGDFKKKTAMLERIDKELIPVLKDTGAYLIITGDHSTPCVRKAHSGHEVPILIYGKNERADSVAKFDEVSCMQGGLGHINGSDIMPLLLNLIEKNGMYGS